MHLLDKYSSEFLKLKKRPYSWYWWENFFALIFVILICWQLKTTVFPAYFFFWWIFTFVVILVFNFILVVFIVIVKSSHIWWLFLNRSSFRCISVRSIVLFGGWALMYVSLIIIPICFWFINWLSIALILRIVISGLVLLKLNLLLYRCQRKICWRLNYLSFKIAIVIF